MKIALLCGGPSPERGISLNSARSVLDHISSDKIEIIPIYFDFQKRAYLISNAQLYSNTPSDFDFKLNSHAKLLSRTELVKILKAADIVFPVMHGAFGEDGEIQQLLEENKIPFIGSGVKACKIAFDKYRANQFLKKLGFFTIPSMVLKIYENDHRKLLEKFFEENDITRAVVKPASGGSSIGVYSVGSVKEALEKVELLFSKRADTRVVVEPFCNGTEFTVIVLQNRFGLPVALLPTEIEADYTKHQIFDFRKKYLPTRQVTYHCPPRFDTQTIEKIQYQAEQLFAAFEMQDFARIDGWMLTTGEVLFSDFNPISGMEQNSFLFQQASRIGFSHQDLLNYIVKNSCLRQAITFPSQENNHSIRKIVHVLFGGSTSERQVSLMSGTNVWLKLRRSKKYRPIPFLLDTNGNVWKLPYTLILNHTVEEIMENAVNFANEEERLKIYESRIRLRLDSLDGGISEEYFLPQKMSLVEFIKKSPYVFIALHGGMGENGDLQKILEENYVKYNGSDSKVSKLCINKWETASLIKSLKIPGVSVTPQRNFSVEELMLLKGSALNKLVNKIKKEFGTRSLIVKPIDDGCSSGIVRINNSDDLKLYLDLIKAGVTHIPNNTFKNQSAPVEMPLEPIKNLILEKFIETDKVKVIGNSLKISRKNGLMEITIGVLGNKGDLKALNPSLTIAEGEVLSVEEKFQGGTGVNITPPSDDIVSSIIVKKARKLVGKIANELGLKDYARIDAFVNTKTGALIIIEVNTLPGLTPSTVIFHQALAENPPMLPMAYLERIIDYSLL